MNINCRGKLLDLNSPIVMGIINITPDSFYANSRCQEEDVICARAEQMINEGAKILDIGGFSTRPGAEEVEEGIEMERLAKALTLIRKNFGDIPVSIDTFRSGIAKTCVADYGADIINDISGGIIDEKMFDVVAELKVPYILMHTVGDSVSKMQEKVTYDNITKDIFCYFAEKIEQLHKRGVKDIILDPGFGFAKDIDQNYELMSHTSMFSQFGLPVLVGISRKRMIWQLTNSTAAESLNGTTALNMIALMQGANILRVHDVKAAHEAITIFNKYNQYSNK